MQVAYTTSRSGNGSLFPVWVFVVGMGLAAISFWSLKAAESGWKLFTALTCLAVVSHLIKLETPGAPYHPLPLVFLFAGATLLPAGQFALLVLISRTAGWAVEGLVFKRPELESWGRCTAATGVMLAGGLTAHWLYRELLHVPGALPGVAPVQAGLLAALAYSLVLNLLWWEPRRTNCGTAPLRGLRRVRWSPLGLETLLTHLILLFPGILVAFLLQVEPWLLLPALAPLYLIQRGLSVPSLRLQANTDPKTGLWNTRYFNHALETELARANRFDRPLTIVMADLDLLRNINNTFGHLAGDAVLIGVSKILKESLREYDVVARFGGEEFAILMPETLAADAFARIESIRTRIETTVFEAPVTCKKVKATMSFGLAGRQRVYPYQSASELVHCADLAVYQAKLQGRNCTNIYTPEIAYGLELFREEVRR